MLRQLHANHASGSWTEAADMKASGCSDVGYMLVKKQFSRP